MKAFLSVLVVTAILAFLVWQRWEGNGAATGVAGGPEILADREAPLSALSPPEPAPRGESTSAGGATPAPESAPVESAPPAPEPPRAIGRADFAREVAGADPLGAMRLASAGLVAADDSPERDAYLAEVLEASGRLLMSRQASPAASLEYAVASGDTIDRLTKRLKKERGVDVTSEFVLRVNGISDPRRLSVGQKLKIVTAAPSLHVSKSRHRLAYLLGGAIVREYRVGLGKADKTPEGALAIGSRLPTPVWFNAGQMIPYGDPRNILGTRWLGFENKPDMSGFGIHGTNDETTIGLDLSNGCVRMRNRDVEELYDLVPIGTKVTIVR